MGQKKLSKKEKAKFPKIKFQKKSKNTFLFFEKSETFREKIFRQKEKSPPKFQKRGRLSKIKNI